MKTFKLKWIKYGAMAMAMGLLVVTSCKKEESTEPVPDTSQEELVAQLETDPDLETFKALDAELYQQVAEILQEQGLTGDDVKRMYENKNLVQLEQIFGDGQLESIMSEITTVNERLYSKYSSLISDEQIANYEERALSGFSGLEQAPEIDSRWCNWRYYGCKGAALAAKSACVAATSGLGVWACWAAYYGASRWCKNRYC